MRGFMAGPFALIAAFLIVTFLALHTSGIDQKVAAAIGDEAAVIRTGLVVEKGRLDAGAALAEAGYRCAADQTKDTEKKFDNCIDDNYKVVPSGDYSITYHNGPTTIDRELGTPPDINFRIALEEGDATISSGSDPSSWSDKRIERTIAYPLYYVVKEESDEYIKAFEKLKDECKTSLLEQDKLESTINTRFVTSVLDVSVDAPGNCEIRPGGRVCCVEVCGLLGCNCIKESETHDCSLEFQIEFTYSSGLKGDFSYPSERKSFTCDYNDC